MQNEVNLIPFGLTRFEFSGKKTGEVLNNICGMKERDRPGSGHWLVAGVK